MSDYMAVNRANWDQRVPVHVASEMYGVQRFVDDPSWISSIVRFDAPRLGDVRGLRGVHLQCHIGTDTLSLARLGADMTGVDFSAPALEQARDLAERAGAAIKYVESDVYGAVNILGPGGFDLVYTGIGALCWLPDIDRWAGVVSALLRPGGRLFMRDGHPMRESVAMVDRQLVVVYPYFEGEPVATDFADTYTDNGGGVLTATRTYQWSHGLGETVTALLGHGMELTGLVEHRSVPWRAFETGMTEGPDGEWFLTEQPERLPLTYTLQAVKR